MQKRRVSSVVSHLSYLIKIHIICLLILSLIGCNVAPTAPRVDGSSSVSQEIQASEASSPLWNDDLPVIDLISFGPPPLGSLSNNRLTIKQAITFNPGEEIARIKVRQVSDLGTRYPTIVIIQDNQIIYKAWQADGSYDILWDGTDFNGEYVYKDGLSVNLLKNGDFRTASVYDRIHTQQGLVEVAKVVIQAGIMALGALYAILKIGSFNKNSKSYPASYPASSSKTLSTGIANTGNPSPNPNCGNLRQMGAQAVANVGSRKGSTLLVRLARTAGLTVVSGGKHLTVTTSGGSLVTQIPHTIKGAGTARAIVAAILAAVGC